MTPFLDYLLEKPLVQKITMRLLYMHKSLLSIKIKEETPLPALSPAGERVLSASKKRMLKNGCLRQRFTPDE
jgi:hypothetical protein